MSEYSQKQLMDLLSHWQTFSELQQLAFEFLAAEAIAVGQEFESSTDGATQVLTQFGNHDSAADGNTMSKVFTVVQQLQAADRSRQGLEQVASVLTTLRSEHAALVQATQTASGLRPAGEMQEHWINAMASNISLTDWRRRLVNALNGIENVDVEPDDCEDELF